MLKSCAMHDTATSVVLIILGLGLALPTQVNSTNDFLHYNNSGRLPDIAVLYEDYCPENSLCTSSQSGTATNGLWCCDSCSCSLQCFQEGNCCPDVLQYANDTLYETCVRPQYLEFGVTNSSATSSYYMIHRCLKEFNDTDIAKKCEIIPRNPRNLEDFLYTLPVSKVNSTVSYRNMYCGLCNGEFQEDLVRWTIELMCDSRQDIQVTSFHELLHILNRDKICNFVYRIPLGIHFRPRVCNWGLFTRCNQKGIMDHYNDTLNDMCEAFTSVYAGTYRNVFCYLCNEVSKNFDCPEFDPGTSAFDTISFTAILDFNMIRYTAPRPPLHMETCSPNQRYDSYKDVCRNMTCATGSIYIDGECKRHYVKEAHKSYDVYIRIAPTTAQNVCVASRSPFGAQLSMSLFSLLDRTPEVKNHICSSAPLFYPAKNQCDDKSLTPIAYMLFHIGIYSNTYIFSNTFHSVDQYLTEISLLDNMHIAVGTYNFTLTLDSGYYGEIAFDSVTDTRNYTDPDTKEMLLELPVVPVVANTCPSPVRHMHVTQMSYCRRVFLSADDYSVRYQQGTLCLESINLCLTNGTYEQTEKGLELCANIYFAHVQNLTRNYSTAVCEESLISALDDFDLVSIICSSISIVFLLLTILTYFLFRALRTTPGKNNMFLSINLLIAQCLFQFGAGQRTLGLGCVVIGVLIHYFWLSTVVWMNICSFHMFRVFSSLKAKTISSHRDEKRDMVTYVIYSVLAPLVIVSVTILISLVTSDWSDIGYGGCICYISSRNMILYTFPIPIAVILFLNLIFFVIVVIGIRRSQHSKLSSNQDKISIVVYLKLSCLTGASWIFGFLYMWIKLDVFGYIFIILTAGLGMFIFLSFICSKRVLKLYKVLLRCPGSNENSSGTNKSSVSYVSTHKNTETNKLSGSYLSTQKNSIQNNSHQITTRM